MGGDVSASEEVMATKLALGTVQFGLPYGIANATGQVGPDEAADILSRARQAGLDTLDTAVGYGQSEAVLGSIGVASWKIVTKLPALADANTGDWVAREVAGSLDRLKVDRLEAVMLHRCSDLLGPQGDTLYRALIGLKDQGLAAKIGYSVYSPRDIDSLFPSFPADIVQAPLNVFDQRLIKSGWLDRLAAAGVEVHARSAFLQGLLLMPAGQRPVKFLPWASQFENWDRWHAQDGKGALDAALAFVLDQPLVDRVVLGVDSLAQFEQILLASERAHGFDHPDFASDDETLLTPSQWGSL
jgi:aryl-alcohol dehydrogenase-like predicted oxidoreductase